MAIQDGDSLIAAADESEAQGADSGLLLVRGLDDLHFQWKAHEARVAQLSDTLCVHAAARSYDVTFLPQDNGFTLTDGQLRIPFSLTYNGVTPGPDYRVSAQVGSPQGDCTRGANASVEIHLDEGKMQAMQPGSYTSTVTMLIAPE
ncbi:hypothetical protein Q4485_08355 [Granulosicoccaceae sp. 1_MG-2023]|nr:hypothetical protein [Granulosicoccaceae sp. 1_MG-2023]